MEDGISPQKSSRGEELEKLINKEKDELPFYLTSFERVFRLKLPLEGSRKLFMSYIITTILLVPFSLGIFICVLCLNSYLNSATTTYFFNYAYFFLGLVQLLVSLSTYLFVGRSSRLIMDRSLLYHLAFKSVLAVVYLIITLALSGQRKDLIMKNPQLLGNMQKLDGVINSLFVFWVFLVRI